MHEHTCKQASGLCIFPEPPIACPSPMASTRPASLSSPAFVLPSSMPMPLRSRTATPSTFTTGVAAAAWIPASASSFPRPTSKSSSNSISSSRTGARPRLTRPPPLNAQPTDEENRPAAHDTKRPRPTGGVGVQWKQLLAYALVALPNLWWAPSPFLASPSSSSSSTGSSPPGAPTATIAFIERLGLTAWPSEAAGLTDEQQLVAVCPYGDEGACLNSIVRALLAQSMPL